MRESRIAFLTSALLLVGVVSSLAQSNDAVMQEALKPSTPLQENLRVLTDEIGGRIPGTPAMQKAIQWGGDAFKAAGADSVHTEEFTIPASWAEGDTEVNVVAPVKFHVRAVSLAWSPPLKPTDGAGGGCRHGHGRRVRQGWRYRRRDCTDAFRRSEDLGRPVR